MFVPTRMIQPVCERFECKVAYAQKAADRARAKRERESRRDTRKRKDALKTRADWAREAQSAVNAYVREIDAGLPCISCGRMHQGQWHAGHYLSRGAHPELALDTRNIHLQCAPCNTHKSGNQALFRVGLLGRHGGELVAWLEGPHPPAKRTIDELVGVRDQYRRMLKEILEAKKNGAPLPRHAIEARDLPGFSDDNLPRLGREGVAPPVG